VSDAGTIALHRRMAPEGETEPEHVTDGRPCFCTPYVYDPNDVRHATFEQVEKAAAAWWARGEE
jgi:hypothetical protein